MYRAKPIFNNKHKSKNKQWYILVEELSILYIIYTDDRCTTYIGK